MRPIFFVAVTFLMVCLPTAVQVPGSIANLNAQTGAAIHSELGCGVVWRYTRYGWQDQATWLRDVDQPELLAERVHPVLLTLNILLGTLFCLVWFAQEDQVDKLLGKNPTP